jgi:hypothetical protein
MEEQPKSAPHAPRESARETPRTFRRKIDCTPPNKPPGQTGAHPARGARTTSGERTPPPRGPSR